MFELMNFLKLSYNERSIAYSLVKRALEAFLLGPQAFLQHKERIRVINNKAFLVQVQTLFRVLNGCTELASEVERMESEGAQHRFNLLYDYAVIFLGDPLVEITLYKVYSKVCQDIYSFLASVAAESKELQHLLSFLYGSVEDTTKKVDSNIDLYDDNTLEAYLEKLQNCSERERLAIHLTPHLNLNRGAYLLLLYNADQACWFVENCADYTLSDSFAKDKFSDIAKKIKQDMGFCDSTEFTIESDVYYVDDQLSSTKLNVFFPFFVTEMGYLDSVEALLEEELVGVNAQTMDGVTMLHIAVKNGYLNIVETLLEKGADPTIKTNKGETAFSLAVSMSLSIQSKINYAGIINALVEKGAHLSIKEDNIDGVAAVVNETNSNVLVSFNLPAQRVLPSEAQRWVSEIEKYSQCLNKKWVRRDLAKKKSVSLMKIVRACKDNGTFFSETQLDHIRNLIQQEQAVLSQHRHWPPGILYFFKQPIFKNRVSSYQKVMALDHAIKCLLAV